MERQEPALAIEGMLELLLLVAFPEGLPANVDRQAVLAAMARRLSDMRPDLAVLAAEPGQLTASPATRVAEHVADPEARENRVREDLARRLGAGQADADAVERVFRIRQTIEEHIRQALHPAGTPAAVPATGAAPAAVTPVEPAGPMSVDTEVEEKVRLLQAYHQERKARLQARSDIIQPRRGGRVTREDAAGSEAGDAPGGSLEVRLDQDATAIGRERLRIATPSRSTPSGRARGRRPGID
jgi:hypothetical protein